MGDGLGMSGIGMLDEILFGVNFEITGGTIEILKFVNGLDCPWIFELITGHSEIKAKYI